MTTTIPTAWCLHCREYVPTQADDGMTVCSECGYPDLANGPPDEDGTANDCPMCGGSGGGEGYWSCPWCAGRGRQKNRDRDDFEIICN